MLAVITAIENDEKREFITKIYVKHYQAMVEKAFYIVKSHEEAEEIVQDAFVKLIENADTLMGFGEKHIYFYAVTVAKHIAINHYKKHKREGIKISLSDENEDWGYWLSDKSAIPEDLFMHKEELKRLAQTVHKLSTRDQILLESKYSQNLPDEEIAKLLDISPASVRCYLTRARRRAYDLLKKGE